MYLEAKQLPKEAKWFYRIDKTWQKIMQSSEETRWRPWTPPASLRPGWWRWSAPGEASCCSHLASWAGG